MTHQPQPERRDGGPRALVVEEEGLVRERAAAMLEGEGFRVCALADPGLFEELEGALGFDLFVIGVPSMERLPERLPRRPLKAPILLLAPVEDAALMGHLRLRAPGIPVADRRLSRPDSLRELLPARERPRGRTLPPAPVRETFAPFGLSERQLEVLDLALRGRSSGEMAKELHVSERTIRNHLHALYERIGVSGRRELLGRFVEGLLG